MAGRGRGVRPVLADDLFRINPNKIRKRTFIPSGLGLSRSLTMSLWDCLGLGYGEALQRSGG